jgi:hypothetical protein
MMAQLPVVVDFWTMPWSAPFRAACRWFTSETQPMRGHKPNRFAPWWLRPLFVHAWVGQAIAARLAWLAAHPQATRYRYGVESEPRWVDAAWASYQRCILREFSDAVLLWIVGMEVERLLRIAEEHPGLVGQVEWTRAVLGASEHLAQLYAELKRRHPWQEARAMLRAELTRFVTWNGLVEPPGGFDALQRQ